MSDSLPETIGHYRVLHLLGTGGMGVVVAARDERLGRIVALKLVRDVAGSDGAARLWREARAAAAVHHPAICQVFEVGEAGQQLFIAMERIEGETLAARLARGPLPVGEAMDVGMALLDVLAAIHAQGLLHRDLKPSNLMLTPHGLKVLDFGLARSSPALEPATAATVPATQAGAVFGTLGYIAPEVLRGGTAEARSDLFAVGVILFEMLAGRPAFPGATAVAVAHAVLHEHPPALSGAPAIAAVDRVLRRALSKDPNARFESAQAMASALRDIQRPDASVGVTARATRRLIVLPFRALIADDDTNFLCASLPDSVTATLSTLDSIVVRSSLAAARFGALPDLHALASGADVDAALTGTLLRAGDRVRVNAQLVEVPSGTLLQSCSFESSAQHVFELHDAMVERLVQALTDHLTPHENARLRRDVPASSTAYELFLRANELAGRDRRRLPEAVEKYRASLAIDPDFAPAWAQLGRVYRVISKYDVNPAEYSRYAQDAFERALALNPELDSAHAFYAQLQADMGAGHEAMRRLLVRAGVRGAASEIYAALVYVCRFCGLTSESITCHHEAHRLDPGVSTSVTQSYFQSGEYLRCLETSAGDVGYIGPLAIDALGRRADATARLRALLDDGVPTGGSRLLIESLLATLEGRQKDCLDHVQAFLQVGYVGCEVQVYLARQLVHVGAIEEGVHLLGSAVEQGFSHAAWLSRDEWLAPVRQRPDVRATLSAATRASDRAREVFRQAGGYGLLARKPAE